MEVLTTIAFVIGALIVTMLLGLVSQWIDRKVSARLQWRVGPPWYQPLADILKLMGKETMASDAARRKGFLLAPLLGLTAAAAAAAIVWLANVLPGHTFA